MCQLDVNDAGSFEEARSFLLNAGIDKIDYLICNAGISNLVSRNTATETNEEEMFDLFRTNVVGVMHTIQTFLDHLKNSEHKLCCAMSSEYGSIAGASMPPGASYRVSKAALNMMMKAFAIDPACGFSMLFSFSVFFIVVFF